MAKLDADKIVEAIPSIHNDSITANRIRAALADRDLEDFGVDDHWWVRNDSINGKAVLSFGKGVGDRYAQGVNIYPTRSMSREVRRAFFEAMAKALNEAGVKP